MKKPPSRA